MLPSDPTCEGSLGSSRPEVRQLQAVSWAVIQQGVRFSPSAPKGASPLPRRVLALRLLFLPVLVACSDLSLAGFVHEGMARTSQMGPLREGRQTLVAS